MVQAEVHMHSRTSIGRYLLFELEEEVPMHRDTIGLEVHLTSEATPPQRNYLGFTSTVV